MERKKALKNFHAVVGFFSLPAIGRRVDVCYRCPSTKVDYNELELSGQVRCR